MNLWDWPALAGADEGELAERLEVEWGVWSRPAGSEGEGDWLATSSGFDRTGAGLGTVLTMLRERTPTKAVAWHTADRASLAVCFDPTGQNGPKATVLQWSRREQTPAVLGAALLLRLAVQASTKAVKHEAIIDSSKELPGLDEDPFRLGRARLESDLDSGMADIATLASSNEAVFVEFYAQLLAGIRPARLRLSGSQLPPQALVALLLPLPREFADRFSITGAPVVSPQSWDALCDARADSAKVEVAHLDRARAMLSALQEGDPRQLPKSWPASDLAAKTQDSIRLALWGPSSAGKTVLLVQLFVHGDSGTTLRVLPSTTSEAFIRQMQTRIERNNRFPVPTADDDVAEVKYDLYHQLTATVASLSLVDQAGRHWQDLRDEHRLQLKEAQGLILLFDSSRDHALLKEEAERTLRATYYDLETRDDRDPRPVAVCLTKVDLEVSSSVDLRRITESSTAFAKDLIAPELLGLLRRYCSNFRLFPVSAVGLKMRYGVVEPLVFYDEDLESRVCSGGRPLNLLEPIEWIFDQLMEGSV